MTRIRFYAYFLALLSIYIVYPLSSQAWTFSQAQEDDYFMLRENNPTFWAINSNFYFKDNSLFNELRSYDSYVLGDAHLRNFSLRYFLGEIHFLYHDYDDSGRASVFIDFLRLFSSADLLGIDTAEVLQNYLSGLHQKQIDLKFMDDFHQIVSKERIAQAERDYLKEEIFLGNDSHWRLNRNKREYRYLTREAQEEVKALFDSKVLDIAEYTRNRGGSYGSRRVRILIEDNQSSLGVSLYELKEVLSPATDFYLGQKENALRIQEVLNFSWKEELHIYYQVVTFEGQDFILRKRTADHTNTYREMINSRNPKNHQRFANLAAYSLGTFHYRSRQEGFESYRTLISENQSLVHSTLKDLSRNYLNKSQTEMKKLLSNHERLTFSGSFRYRMQRRQEEGKEARAFQHKFRLRLGVEASISPNLKMKVLLETNKDPRSPNVDFEDFFESKPLYIAQTYVSYQLYNYRRILEIQLGKVPKPFVKVGESELIWDRSVNPEGLTLLYDDQYLFFRFGAYLLDEQYRGRRGINEPDTNVITFQLGREIRSLLWRFTFGFGGTYFRNITELDVSDTWEGEAEGNTINEDDEYKYNYYLHEVFAEIRHRMAYGYEAIGFGHYLYNRAISSDNRAYRYGVGLKYNKWNSYIAYTKAEPDSAFAAMSDSTPARGGTDYLAYDYSLEYEVSQHMNIIFRHIFAKSDLVIQEKFRKSRLDFNFSF